MARQLSSLSDHVNWRDLNQTQPLSGSFNDSSGRLSFTNMLESKLMDLDHNIDGRKCKRADQLNTLKILQQDSSSLNQHFKECEDVAAAFTHRLNAVANAIQHSKKFTPVEELGLENLVEARVALLNDRVLKSISARHEMFQELTSRVENVVTAQSKVTTDSSKLKKECEKDCVKRIEDLDYQVQQVVEAAHRKRLKEMRGKTPSAIQPGEGSDSNNKNEEKADLPPMWLRIANAMSLLTTGMRRERDDRIEGIQDFTERTNKELAELRMHMANLKKERETISQGQLKPIFSQLSNLAKNLNEEKREASSQLATRVQSISGLLDNVSSDQQNKNDFLRKQQEEQIESLDEQLWQISKKMNLQAQEETRQISSLSETLQEIAKDREETEQELLGSLEVFRNKLHATFAAKV